jgi:hypothetical protein
MGADYRNFKKRSDCLKKSALIGEICGYLFVFLREHDLSAEINLPKKKR